MQLDTDLTAHLAFNLTIPVEQNKIAEDYSTSAICFFRAPSYSDLLLNGDDSIQDSNFDVEVYGLDVDSVEETADAARALLNGFRGLLGQTTVLGAFVSDHTSEYTPKVEQNTDEGLNVSTFTVQILHY